MAKTPTATDAPQPQTDVLPDIDGDDVVVDSGDQGAQPEARADAPVEQDAPGGPAPKSADPRRDDAVRRYRELRDQQMQAAGDAEPPVDEAAPTPAPVAQAQPPVVAPAPAADASDEPVYEVKVHGATRKIKQSELVAKAQIALASENILEETKAVLREVKEEARALREKSSTPADQRAVDDGSEGQDDRSSDGQAPANPPKAKVDPEKLRTIVQRIQIGDEDEGVQAAAELLELAASPAQNAPPQDLGKAVQTELVRARLADEVVEATKAFKETHGSLVADPELLGASLSRFDSELRADLAKVGVAPDATKALNTDQLLDLHQRARMSGRAELRAYGDIMGKVGADMTAKYGAIIQPTTPDARPTPQSQPQQQPSNASLAQRIDRKRAATPQPRTAGVRMPTAPPQQAKTPQQVVAEMRRSRGFKGYAN